MGPDRGDFDFFGSTGEMARLVRSFDWAAHPLGSPSSWPQTLRSILGVCLDAHFPIAIWWGPDYIQFYNDAYRPILGTAKHPAALGRRARETWPEIWSVIGPMAGQVMTRGVAIHGEDNPLVLERSGYPELCHFTFSYSPIRDESGGIVGMFIPAVETTSRVLAEKRQAFALEFADAIRDLSAPQDITATACEFLGKRLDVASVSYAETDGLRDRFTVKAKWEAGSAPPIPESGRIGDYGPELVALLRAGQPAVIEDVAADPRTHAHAATYTDLQVGSLLAIPFVKAGELITVLTLFGAAPRRWEQEYIVLAEDVVDRTRSAVERARAEAALNAERDRSREILGNMDEAFILLDPDFCIIQANAGALQLEQRRTPEIVGRRFADAWPRLDASELGKVWRRAMAERVAVRLEHYHTYPDGRGFWFDMHAYPHRDGLAIFFRDITESKLAEQRVLAAAQHDVLTGLPNRALVFEYAEHLLAAAQRSHSHGAFLFIDLDRFKPVNDIYGHEVGDRLLQEVAKRLTRCVRQEDLVGRLGGDEFIVVLHPVGEAFSPTTVAEHIRDALSRPFEIDSLDLAISACIGISRFPEHGTDVDELVRAADLAMYQVKYDSRGSYHVYTPALNRRADESAAIEARLKRALQHEGLFLHYQPIVDVKTGGLSGVEALLRMADENGRVIGPDRFIPIAEAAGLIGELGEWVAREACVQHKAWRGEGLPAVAISVNVSPLEFRQRGFAQQLRGIVRETGLEPACLLVEVTESTVMGNVEDAIRTLKELRTDGIRIALDDFGTGHSSLSHLSSLPLDKLKVDRSFIQRLQRDESTRAITAAIIALGKTLGLEIVGEGIESGDALKYLEEHGCNQAQGYFISHPLSGRDFACWYRKRS
ncbi:putative bifunctional diguanylate cyclase/phosphodiesterase [Aromatoleum sp.]|uniref:putative bifunctional diguanylate cyclase/phosphodiesterase n=1 Tax=Aromatoleum sp. TaxID=2307007 RepID=UPI002FCB897A